MTDQQPIQWWQSSQIRVALLLLLPLLVRLLKALHILDLTQLTNEDLVNFALSLLAAGSSIFWVIKRVKAGINPKNDTAPIETPKIVTAVKRLTNG